jgi:hypothetical protein
VTNATIKMVLMDRKIIVIAAVLTCCLIFSGVSAAQSTPATNTTNGTKVIKTQVNTTATSTATNATKVVKPQVTPATASNTTSTVKAVKPVQSVNTTKATKVLGDPTVISITPNSGSLGDKVAFNLTGSNFDKTAKVYLETEVKNKTKSIEAAKNDVVSETLISGNFKMPTSVPAGDWNVVVKQKGKVSSSNVKFTLKE